ncbi:MFS transporter [Thiothrix subterranea]|uniref:MFS transporter n=1 Tax=Thiothrix subterranea TaxID=2735563 RepID=A0AA51QYS4_9GAMM|nr:MFS transporter [Thiothrix subterranea]MDQ5769289.1 MFS transporter [Thiothrix subterranea]WML86272.1 MFS transporter [Thiothrix subterranea]
MAISTSTSPQTHWSLIIIATVAGFAAAFNVGKIAPSLPALQAELGLSLFQMSWIVSSFSVIAMLFALPAALFSVRLGAYRMALTALAMLGLGALGGAYAEQFAVLLLCRLLEGMGYVLIAVSAPALISQVAQPQHRTTGMTVWSTWIPIGVSLMLLTAPLVLQAYSWREVWLLTAFFAFAWLLILGGTFFSHHNRAMPNTHTNPVLLVGIFKPDPLKLAASFMCFSAVFIIAISFMPTVWLKQKGVPITQSSGWMALIILSSVMGNGVGGWLVSKGIATSRILVSSFVIPACLASWAFLDIFPLWLQISCIGLFVFIGSIVPGTLFAVTPTYATTPAQVSLLVGLIFQGAAIGQVIGPVLFSAIIDASGGDWRWALGFYGFFALLGGWVMSSIKPPQTR